MSRICEVTGKKPMSGNNVSHAKNRTRRRFLPNLQMQFWWKQKKRWVSLRVSRKGLRIIEKKGIETVLKGNKEDMREKIKLVSSAKTGHYYTTTKNKKTSPDKMEIKKFDPVVRKHVVYKESKIK